MQEIGKVANGMNINVIPNNIEKYVALSLVNIWFSLIVSSLYVLLFR